MGTSGWKYQPDGFASPPSAPSPDGHMVSRSMTAVLQALCRAPWRITSLLPVLTGGLSGCKRERKAEKEAKES